MFHPWEYVCFTSEISPSTYQFPQASTRFLRKTKAEIPEPASISLRRYAIFSSVIIMNVPFYQYCLSWFSKLNADWLYCATTFQIMLNCFCWNVATGPGGGTRYIFGWGGAGRSLKPWPCLRQKSSGFWYPV